MYNEEIGNRIKELRKKKKITQKQLAEILKKSESSIQKYESGDVEIPQSVLDEIAKALDTDLLYLFGYDDKKWEDDFDELMALSNERPELKMIRAQLEQLGYYLQTSNSTSFDIKQSVYILSYNDTKIVIPEYEFENLYKSLKSYMKFMLQELIEKYK